MHNYNKYILFIDIIATLLKYNKRNITIMKLETELLIHNYISI